MPDSEPVLWRRLAPESGADGRRLGAALSRLATEDPTLHVRPESDDHFVIAGLGERQLQIVVDRLTSECGIRVTASEPRVIFKTAISREAEGEGLYVKRTGGRAQYGHAKIRLVPRHPGEGTEFQNRLAGGTLPSEFAEAIDAGIREFMAEHAIAGRPIVDVTIELYDGSYHDLESSRAAFTIAGVMAFQEAMRRAAPDVLEPVMLVQVEVPTGDRYGIESDLATRGGDIDAISLGEDTQVICCSVPLSGMLGYATALRSRTQGRGTYSMQFKCYQQRRSEPGDADDDAIVGARRPPPHGPRDSRTGLPEPEVD